MRRALSLLLVLMLTAIVGADGKMFGVQGSFEQPGIQHQRAVLSWHEGEQTLIVENVVKSEAEAAWLLPLPGKPSQIEALPDGYFQVLNARYRMRVINNPDYIFGAVLIFLFVVVAAFSVRKSGALSFLTQMGLAFLVIALLGLFCFPVFGGSSFSPSPAFNFTSVADYKVAVIGPADRGAGVAWLRKGGFAVSPEEEQVLTDYADKGWHFVAAKLDPEADLSRPHPLMIRCPSAKPVYPMKLTGLQGGPLNLELYVVGKAPARAAGFNTVNVSTISNYFDGKPMVFPVDSAVTRFAGRFNLSPATEDIEPSWDGDRAQTTTYWTRSGKGWSVVERACFAASLAIVLITPWLLKKRSRNQSILISLGAGVLGGLAWSIPIFAGPVVESGKGRSYWPAIHSHVLDARNVKKKILTSDSLAQARETAEQEDNSKPRGNYPPLNAYFTTEFSKDGVRVISVEGTGEPIFEFKKWPAPK